MNTRLQVEHPVTEYITGLDLVEWQLRVADGERLPQSWSELQINGHAIEARIYAEDALNGFLPSTGLVSHLAMPEPGPHVRIDSGIRAGDRITVHYDPMIAKLIVWGEDRATAVRRMREALSVTAVAGVTSNSGFLLRLASHPAFASAELDTGFIGRHEAALLAEPVIGDASLALATLGILLERQAAADEAASRSADPHSPWARPGGFRLNLAPRETLIFALGGEQVEVSVSGQPRGYRFEIGGRSLEAEGNLSAEGLLDARIDGRKLRGRFWGEHGHWDQFADGDHFTVTLPDPFAEAEQDHAHGGLTAPMPGIIRAVLAAPGERVEKGRALVIMEAMKMEHTIRAPADGIVEAINAVEGAMTEAGTVLVSFLPEAGA
jgi:3-methylcrotonyl-CoA carboxylase alpha subunit